MHGRINLITTNKCPNFLYLIVNKIDETYHAFLTDAGLPGGPVCLILKEQETEELQQSYLELQYNTQYIIRKHKKNHINRWKHSPENI